MPGFVAGLMKLGQFLKIDNQVIFVRSCFAFFSLQVVAAFFWYGWRKGKSQLAWLLGLIAAFWPDFTLGSFRTLGEFQAGNLLDVSVIFILAYRETPPSRKALLYASIAGFYIGLTAAIRFQLAPAAAVAFVFLFQRHKQKEVFLALFCAILPVLFLAILDKLTLGAYFQSIFKNFYMNISLGVAKQFGSEWFGYYLVTFVKFWSVAAVLIVLLIFKAGREKYIPLCVAIAVVLVHSCITHKEPSFIYAAAPLLLLCAGLGCHKLLAPSGTWSVQFPLCFVLGAGSLFLSCYVPYLAHANVGMLFESKVTHAPDSCGLGLLSTPLLQEFPSIGAGYSGLTKQMPLYLLASTNDVNQLQSSFNYLIVTAHGITRPDIAPQWQLLLCKHNRLCLYKRVGPCTGKADYEQFSKKVTPDYRPETTP